MHSAIRVSLLLVLICFNAQPSKADIFGITDFVGDIIGDILGDATGPSVAQFKDAMLEAENHLFNDLLPPLISKLDVMGAKMIATVDKDIQETVEHVKRSLNDTIHEAAKVAMEFADHELEEIEKLVNGVLDGLNKLETKVVQDINEILDKASELVKEIDCSVEGISQTWTNEIRAAADDGWFPNLFEKCRWELNLGFARVTSLDDFTVYRYWKCKLLEKITKDSNQDEILGYVAQGQLTAARYRCISRMSPVMSEVYTKEFIAFGEMYNAWNIDSWPSLSEFVDEE